MGDDVAIGMAAEGFVPWRCLHGGPLTERSIEQLPGDQGIPWAEFRARNMPLLKKFTRIYGGCAVVARDGERVVGTLRFYPKALCTFTASGGAMMCLQQAHPAGPAHDFAQTDFPPLEQLEDKSLFVHCMMIAPAPQGEPGYRRRGIGTRMARHLIEWARARGWHAIEATAYEDLDIVYGVTGVAGRTFWEKLGFRVAAMGVEPGFEQYPDILRAMIEQGRALGLSAEDVKRKYAMRLGLR